MKPSCCSSCSTHHLYVRAFPSGSVELRQQFPRLPASVDEGARMLAALVRGAIRATSLVTLVIWKLTSRAGLQQVLSSSQTAISNIYREVRALAAALTSLSSCRASARVHHSRPRCCLRPCAASKLCPRSMGFCRFLSAPKKCSKLAKPRSVSRVCSLQHRHRILPQPLRGSATLRVCRNTPIVFAVQDVSTDVLWRFISKVRLSLP